MIPLRLLSAASETGAAIQEKIHGSGRCLDLVQRAAALIISNGEMENIMKTIKALEDSVLIIKVASEPIKNETKEQNGGFLDILLEAIDGSFFRKYVSR